MLNTDCVTARIAPHPFHHQKARYHERDQPDLTSPTFEELTHS